MDTDNIANSRVLLQKTAWLSALSLPKVATVHFCLKPMAITPGHSDFDSGNMFYSSASGEKKEYFAVLGMQRTSSFFMMQKDGDCWKPTAAIMPVVFWYHFWTKV